MLTISSKGMFIRHRGWNGNTEQLHPWHEIADVTASVDSIELHFTGQAASTATLRIPAVF